MNRFHLWAMRRLMRAALYNSMQAQTNVAQLLEVVIQELRETYYEDNLATIVHHFEECSNDALTSLRMNSIESAAPSAESTARSGIRGMG